MSLGSSQQIDAEDSMKLLITAAKLLDANVFLQTTSKKYQKDTIENNIYFFADIPHGLILKYCDAAVHHGGAGTTQTVIKYGVPALILGFASEQMSWGTQIYKLKLGEKPIKYNNATPEKIIKSIKRMLENPVYKENLLYYSEKIKNENGLKNVVEIINSL